MLTEDVETRRQPELEEFWDDLLAFIQAKLVVPIVGPELLTVVIDGREVPLYRAVAKRLLRKYGLQGRGASDADLAIGDEVLLRPHYELHDAISALVQHKHKELMSLYRPIHEELGKLLTAEQTIPSALRELAEIADFNLFVTTTSDDLLARAIRASRPNIGIDTVAYAPNLPAREKHDLTERAPRDYACVFHLFGKASPRPTYAVCDEDVLEFIYSLQAGQGPRPAQMLAELRDSHLLLIGCNFAD